MDCDWFECLALSAYHFHTQYTFNVIVCALSDSFSRAWCIAKRPDASECSLHTLSFLRSLLRVCAELGCCDDWYPTSYARVKYIDCIVMHFSYLVWAALQSSSHKSLWGRRKDLSRVRSSHAMILLPQGEGFHVSRTLVYYRAMFSDEMITVRNQTYIYCQLSLFITFNPINM